MDKENNKSNINLKKKHFIISLVLVSFVSIILVTTSIISSTSNNNIPSVDAQTREPPPKSSNQFQAEEQQQEKGQPDTAEEACVALLKALINKGPKRGEFGSPKTWQDITCPSGLKVRFPAISDLQAIGQLCGPVIRDQALELLDKYIACKAGTCPECNPCETEGRGTTCPSPFLGIGYQCADLQNSNDHCGVCGKECDTSVGEKCISGQCQGCSPGTHWAYEFNRCVPDCPNIYHVNLPPTGETCGCYQPNTSDPYMAACGEMCRITDLRFDENNCSNCGNVCPSGTTCNNGVCQCPTGQHEGSISGVAACVPDCTVQGQINNPSTGICECPASGYHEGTISGVPACVPDCIEGINDPVTGECTYTPDCNPGLRCVSGPINDGKALCIDDLPEVCFVDCPPTQSDLESCSLSGYPTTCCLPQLAPYSEILGISTCQVPGQYEIDRECTASPA